MPLFQKWIFKFTFMGALFVFAMMTAISIFGWTESYSPADVIVIFGNTVYEDGSLSPRLQARMDRGIELYQDGKGKILFVSGGVGKEGVDEAEAMKRYAQLKGVPDDAIIQDSRGTTTHATTENLSAFFKEKEYHSAILVSQFFHLARASLSCKNMGIQECGRSYARYLELRDIYAVAREVPAYINYLFSQQ